MTSFFRSTGTPARAPWFSSLNRNSNELEGAPPFAPFAKGGLLRSNTTDFFLLSLRVLQVHLCCGRIALGFSSPKPRIENG
jgi:hypothetical protein